MTIVIRLPSICPTCFPQRRGFGSFHDFNRMAGGVFAPLPEAIPNLSGGFRDLDAAGAEQLERSFVLIT
jgi:hypothetical protein